MPAPFGKRPGTLIRQESPFNAGPTPDRLRASFVTPVEDFFVRNHGAVPEVDAASFRLIVRGAVERPLELSLAELDRFPRRELTATLQCAGNRRQELAEHRPIPHELPWGVEAVSTARWSGVALVDLLGAARPAAGASHVAFAGLDEAERHGQRFRFGGSIPLDKALAPEVLLATAMNGAPLPAVHGFPVRVVVPGWIGARSVKWLSEIALQAEPSDNYFQRVAYRLFPADVDAGNVVWGEGAMLGELPVNSIVTRPEPGARLPAGPVRIEGFALAGGGREVARVEVSADGGRGWRQARLGAESGRWAWRFWACELELGAGRHELAVRAWDSAANSQPADVDQVWNFKGYMNNAWQRVPVEVV
jgi:sulfite oxidase